MAIKKKKANRIDEAFNAWVNAFHKEVRKLGYTDPIDDDHVHLIWDRLTPEKAAKSYIESENEQ